MKLKYFALAMAFTMALALTGCSANRDGNVDNTAPVRSTNSVSADQNDRPSAGVGSGSQNSTGVGDAIDDIGDAVGDAAQGAGDAIGDVGSAVGDAVGDAANGTGTGRAMP